ncbi:MAG: type II toxin-antitoxin system VapC family toxin [Gammaproteobacteria bacterium]|nr:MAG: type II toxin-antitoxin system VapC family toxin [Gammaproteobacteria bacterium]
MRALLDTHTFIWMVAQEEKLSARATEVLQDTNTTLYLSAASIWEMVIKASLGKLVLTQPLATLINTQVQINGLNVLNIQATHALGVASLPWHHRDPFDRLLISQSKVESLAIIGRDTKMDAYGISRIW